MSFRYLARILFTAALSGLALTGAVNADAAGSSPVSLTVSTPAAPLDVRAGHSVTSWLRITNASATPLPVTIAPATVKVGENGATRLTAGPDPRFPGGIVIDPRQTVVRADSYTTVPVRITVPAALTPDTYLLGFLITPEAAPAGPGGSIHVLNQVGALIALDLPGARDERLAATLVHTPAFAFTSHPSLTARIRATGRSAVTFTTETTVAGLGGAAPTDIRRPPTLVAAGYYRDTTIGWHPAFGIGLYHLRMQIVYHHTDAQTAQVVLTRTVFVLAPAALGVLTGTLLAAIAVLLTLVSRRRRRARRQPGQHSRARNPSTLATARVVSHRAR